MYTIIQGVHLKSRYINNLSTKLGIFPFFCIQLNRGVSMSAYDFIKDAILTGKFEPGLRLTEESIAKELNISRTPVREAIKQLEAEGLIIPLKRGVSVRHFTLEDIRQIYDLRSLLEGYAAGQAAIYRTESDLAKITEANQLYEQAIERYTLSKSSGIKNIVNANQRFHESIVAASKNDHITFHISKVVVVPLVFRSFYWYDFSKLRRSLDIHKTILTAIQNRDSERARIAMHEHIYQGRDIVMSHLEDIKNQYVLKEDR